MQVHITYIQHNCFCLSFADRLLLFDCPGPEYRSRTAENRLQEELTGREVDVLISHSHADHFARDIRQVVQPAAETRFVVADDVADLHEDRIPRESLVLEPGSSHCLGDATLYAFPSNDSGVAFLLRKQGAVLYFGGDLADWQWPGLPRSARRATSIHFCGVLQELKHLGVDLAFSNTDPRLENLAGAPRFVNRVAPDFFVPMHAFGHTDRIPLLRERLSPDTQTKLFLYRECGDFLLAELSPKAPI